MVPDKFNMVDMEGIDIITSQGEAVEGLYQKLVESIAQCRYQCLYNWKFDGILIPPTYVEMDIVDDVVWINEGVSVDEEDVVRVYSLERPGNLMPIAISANGDYLPPEGYDGFDSVNVYIPPPVLDIIQITENGSYAPPQGVDGFSGVTVNVPSSEPVLDELNVTTNGTYTPPSGIDGYDQVVVNVPSGSAVIQPITITQNGTTVAPSGVDGYSPITVNVQSGSVPQLAFHLGRLTVNTGEIVESNEYCYSDLIPITTGNGRWLLDLARTDMDSYYIGVCIYKSDGQTYTGYLRQYQSYRVYQSSGIGEGRYMRLANKVANLPFAALAFFTDNIYITGTQSTIKKANL